MNQEIHPCPVIFGEVLFDRFPDDTAVLGGAPFNVAWNLKGFGLDPLFVSRIGDDKYGRQIRRSMLNWGLDDIGLQTDPQRPSGVVEITLDAGQHSFSIIPDCAYDFIDRKMALSTAESAIPKVLYHGTLATRHSVARAALRGLLADLDWSVFLDVNLRDPWWRSEALPAMLSRGRWVKLNDDELQTIGAALGLQGADLEQQAAALQEAFSIELLIVTRGSQGAFARSRDGTIYSVTPESRVDVVDTVGAGDAFSSVILLGLLQGWDLQRTLQCAQGFASSVCALRGATVNDPEFYQEQRKAWPQ